MSKVEHSVEEATRFSRAWWMSVGRNFFWIALVTVLIWMYADMRQTDTEEITATIKLTTGGDKDLVIISADNVQVAEQDVQVIFKLAGSRDDLDRFKKEHAEAKPVITFDVSRNHHGERRAITLRTIDIVRDARLFAEMGLSVDSASPDTITVHMDRLVLKELPVELAYAGAILADKAKITPPTAKIRVTESTWAIIRKAHPKPVIKTENLDLKQARPGQTVSRDLKLAGAVADEKVIPVTETVHVTVKVGQHTDTKELTVSVAVLAPPEWSEDDTWEKFVLVRKDKLEWWPKITVTGPKTDLEKLEESKKEVIAYIVLSERHKKPIETWETEEVQIRFPQKLKLKLAGKTPKVSFKIKPRGEASAPP